MRSDFNPQRFEFAIESGYLLGAINAPAGYEIGAEFLTGRIRWGVIDGDTWLRGYHQFYISAMGRRTDAGSRTTISDLISAFVIILCQRAAGSLRTFPAE